MFTFSFLIGSVCRRWNALRWSSTLWKKVDVKFHNFQNTVTKHFVTMLPSCVTSIRLYYSSLDCTEQLNFEELCVKLQRRCPRLEKLILERVHLTDSLPSVIALCTHFLPGVKVLVFRHSKFSMSPTREEFDGISKIEILDVSDSVLGIQFPCEIQFSKMPQLRVLNLRNTYINSRIFRQLPNNGLNLEELYVCGTFVTRDYLLFTSSMFPRLKILCLDFHFCTRTGIPFVVESCQTLQKVYIGERFVKTKIHMHPFFERNRCKYNIVVGVDEDHIHNVDYSCRNK